MDELVTQGHQVTRNLLLAGGGTRTCPRSVFKGPLIYLQQLKKKVLKYHTAFNKNMVDKFEEKHLPLVFPQLSISVLLYSLSSA